MNAPVSLLEINQVADVLRLRLEGRRKREEIAPLVGMNPLQWSALMTRLGSLPAEWTDRRLLTLLDLYAELGPISSKALPEAEKKGFARGECHDLDALAKEVDGEPGEVARALIRLGLWRRLKPAPVVARAPRSEPQGPAMDRLASRRLLSFDEEIRAEIAERRAEAARRRSLPSVYFERGRGL